MTAMGDRWWVVGNGSDYDDGGDDDDDRDGGDRASNLDDIDDAVNVGDIDGDDVGEDCGCDGVRPSNSRSSAAGNDNDGVGIGDASVGRDDGRLMMGDS